MRWQRLHGVFSIPHFTFDCLHCRQALRHLRLRSGWSSSSFEGIAVGFIRLLMRIVLMVKKARTLGSKDAHYNVNPCCEIGWMTLLVGPIALTQPGAPNSVIKLCIYFSCRLLVFDRRMCKLEYELSSIRFVVDHRDLHSIYLCGS